MKKFIIFLPCCKEGQSKSLSKLGTAPGVCSQPFFTKCADCCCRAFLCVGCSSLHPIVDLHILNDVSLMLSLLPQGDVPIFHGTPAIYSASVNFCQNT